MCIYRPSETNNFYKLIIVCCPEHKVPITLCSEMHGYSHGYLKSAAISQLLRKQIDVTKRQLPRAGSKLAIGNLHAAKPLPATAQPP